MDNLKVTSKKQEEIIEKEVKKRMYQRLYARTKGSASRFSREFKKHAMTAVSAGFGFLIALSWRDVISDGVNSLVEKLGVGEQMIFYKLLSAVVVTIIAVLGLMLVSRWASEKG